MAQENKYAIQSDEEFEQLFRLHFLPLKAYAQKWLKDPLEAEEIVQEVFVQLWEKRFQLNINTSIKAYLFRAVYHKVLNIHRHEKVRHAHQEYAQSKGTKLEFEDPAETVELKDRIAAAIGMLPQKCGEVFKMSRLEGLSYKEIAQKMNISPKTVEVQMGKALKLLRKSLRDYLPILFWIFFLWNKG
ncbi:MAG: RNA polymerase sigma-70 factor [Bacteroidia bacterium]|nr:RNA polymerase sigma-70 factor [Bacteroidia bacterium]